MTAAIYGCCDIRPVYLGSFADPRSAKVGQFQAALRNLTANRAVFAASTFALNISAAHIAVTAAVCSCCCMWLLLYVTAAVCGCCYI